VDPIAVDDRSYFVEATESPGLVVGKFIVSRIDGLKTLPLALPVWDGDRLEGVVIAGLDLDWLAETMRQRDYLGGAALTVADRNGVIIAREPFPETFVGAQIPEPFMPLVRGHQSGSMLVTSQDGTRRIIGYHPPAVGRNGLYVSAGLSTDTAFRPIYASTLQSLAIAGFGAIAALGLAWLAGDRLVRRPVSRILATVERWRHGDEAARTGIAASSSELDTLAQAVDEYMDALTADRAARRKAEANRDLLLAELEHRVKNVLATVQVIATQTFKGSGDPERLQTFRQRLVAMGEAHAMLSSDDWQRAGLRATIAAALRPFGLDQERRIALRGPPLQIARPSRSPWRSTSSARMPANTAPSRTMPARCPSTGRS
jgi:signal transduction histidine kinase